jgi:RNA polymerase sigma-70 factor (sigma-E family)
MDGDDGFRDFVATYGAALSRTAFLLTGDHQLAEDLVQSTLARTATHWRRVAAGNPQAYVRRAMINQRTSWWRRHRYGRETPVPTDALHTLVTSRSATATAGTTGTAGTADAADAVVQRLTVVAALAQLPPRQRAVIVLRYFDDLGEAATARALNCSVGTVKSQAHAALARLRALAPMLLSDGPDRSAGRADSPAGGAT